VVHAFFKKDVSNPWSFTNFPSILFFAVEVEVLEGVRAALRFLLSVFSPFFWQRQEPEVIQTRASV
jgi:hypothetical protein